MLGERKIGATIIVTFAFIISILNSGLPAYAQKPTPSEVERLVRAQTDILNSNDPVRIVESQSSDIWGVGFGFRTRAPRTPMDKKSALAIMRDFFSTTVYYRVTLDEVHTAVDGEVGIAWGFWTESFQVRGQKPEAVKVRFSVTYKHEPEGWRVLLYHRDTQTFDNRGQYISVPVSASK